MRDGQVVSEKLRELGVSDIRLLVNRVNPASFRAVGETIDNVIDTVGARLLGIIREDREVPQAANLETPLVLYSRKSAARGFLRAAQRIEGKRIPVSSR